jgi:hypothetical protein
VTAPHDAAAARVRADGGATAAGGAAPLPYDPLRLCVYATIALIAWAAGPWAVVGFAALGFAGYWRARRAGLTRSRCLLRDTRLVLAYLGVLALVGLAGAAWTVAAWFG